MAEGDFEFQGYTYSPPVKLVKDRDGNQMPYNPKFTPEDFDPDPLVTHNSWGRWWCGCGHLVVDHHVDDQSGPPKAGELTMGCWAVLCPCRIRFG